jgi:ABC-type transport system involved in multi-copper enzyme maturation permease subunit
MRRELGIALRSRVTWLFASLSALLVGHGFLLAVDLYSAASRSALASSLQTREMDPLAGIVRPTLGGLDLALTLLAPLVAARVLAVEKERGTFGALCLLEGSADRVVLKKLVAALAATGLSFVAPLAAFIAFRAAGAHLDAIETGLALAGEALHLVLVVSVSIAAAAWTRTLAQAASLGVVVSVTSWAIDAAEGFAALAWLGGASAWSIERHLAPFQRGVVSLGSLAWLVVATAGAVALAITGARFDWSPLRRAAVTGATIVATGVLLVTVARSRRAYDWTEQRRASLPPAAVDGLRRIPQSIALDVYLDRDDSRRRELESDVVAKLYLARPDVTVRVPLDDRTAVAEAERDPEYGRIVVRVGSSSRETRSTSRREIVSLVFEAAGMPLPVWSAPTYNGFPFVADGARRGMLGLFAYFIVPFGLLTTGAVLTRRRSAR